MCSKNTWGEVGALNHPGWQHMIFFRARTRYAVRITHNYNHTLFTGSHGGFWESIKGYRHQEYALRTPEVSGTVLWTIQGDSTWFFFFYKNWVFLVAQEQTVSCKGPLGAARAAQLCSGGWPQSIDYIPKSKGGTCHCRRFVPSLVVLLRPIESDYSRVPNVAPPSPPPEIYGYPKKRLIFGPF